MCAVLTQTTDGLQNLEKHQKQASLYWTTWCMTADPTSAEDNIRPKKLH